MKQILVISGAGKQTSKTVADKLTDMLSDRGVGEIDVKVTDLKNLKKDAANGDMLVSTMLIDNCALPVFSGLPFLTGIRLNEELEKIVCAL